MFKHPTIQPTSLDPQIALYHARWQERGYSAYAWPTQKSHLRLLAKFLTERGIATLYTVLPATLVDFQRWLFHTPTMRGTTRPIVALFPRHADLPFLENALHLEGRGLDGLDDLLGLVAVEALLDDKVLRGVAERRDDHVLPLHIAEVDVPPGELADDDFVQALQPCPVLGFESDLLTHRNHLAALQRTSQISDEKMQAFADAISQKPPSR